MRQIIVYAPDGSIVGRVQMSDPTQANNYPMAVDVDAEDFNSEPERWAEVDIQKKTLHPKPGKVDPTSRGRKVKRPE